jgi:uncharacterized Zn-finger protein
LTTAVFRKSSTMVGSKRGRPFPSPSSEGERGEYVTSNKKRGVEETGQCVFACTFCGKAFPRSHSLTTHMRTHNGDRPYVSITYNMTSPQFGHLNEHICTHTGDRPCACTTCGQTFSGSSKLTIHARPYWRAPLPLHHLRQGLQGTAPCTLSIMSEIDGWSALLCRLVHHSS